MTERSVDARLIFLFFPALSLVLAGAAVRGYGVRLSWNVLSFVPVIAAAVVLIVAQRKLRRFLQTTQVQSVADAQNIFVIVFGARMAPALASTAVGLLIVQFTGVASALQVGQACALILYVRAWPGARTCDVMRTQIGSDLFDEWLDQNAGRPRVPWQRR